MCLARMPLLAVLGQILHLYLFILWSELWVLLTQFSSLFLVKIYVSFLIITTYFFLVLPPSPGSPRLRFGSSFWSKSWVQEVQNISSKRMAVLLFWSTRMLFKNLLFSKKRIPTFLPTFWTFSKIFFVLVDTFL